MRVKKKRMAGWCTPGIKKVRGHASHWTRLFLRSLCAQPEHYRHAPKRWVRISFLSCTLLVAKFPLFCFAIRVARKLLTPGIHI